MQSATRYLIVAGIASGCISMLFFLSLAFSIPFAVVVPAVVVSVGGVFWWAWVQARNTEAVPVNHPKWAFLLLLTGVILIVERSYPLAEKYGGWDAWSIWNLHAKYLAAGGNKWQMIFNNTIGHTDYPLLVPGFNGFFIRLCSGTGAAVIPFLFSFSIMLLIPVLLFLESVKYNIITAGILIMLISNDIFYFTWGVSQYADTALSFFFLCALIAIEYAAYSRTNAAVAAACLGCCIWTKNEGVVLSVIFIAFNYRLIFKRQNVLHFLAGIAVPVAVFLVFKLSFGASNDLLASQGKETLKQVFITDRYSVIYSSFMNNVNAHFYYIKIGFIIYMLHCLFSQKRPDKQMAMLLMCLAAYMMIYVVSAKNLDWHLATSQDRLMHQLMPAMLFVLFKKFSTPLISLPKQQFF